MPAVTIHPILTGTGQRDRATFLVGSRSETITIPFLMFYVRTGDRHLLVDTGVGPAEATAAHHHPMAQTPEQSPVAALARLGVRPDEIDVVINTHLHWDHCYNNAVFPRATVYAQRREIQYAIAPLPLHVWAYDTIELDGDRPLLPPFLRSRLTLVDGEFEVAPGVSVIPTPGHTPGSQSVVVRAERRTYVLAGDNVPLYENLPGRFRPHFTPNGIHVDLESYYGSLARLAALGGEILPSHDARVLDRERYE
jgi:glyoxylase-like metal-dependent hydrolase (beta-lactamase superfamily II)